jgi:diguanylate cyclase (GGDEF)-like protein
MTAESEQRLESGLLAAFRRLERAESAEQPRLWQTLEEQFGPEVYTQVIHLLTRKRFAPEEARGHWRAILEHNRSMSRALGREVGVRAAMCDYFINLAPAVRDPLLVEAEMYRQKEQSAVLDELTGLYNRRFFNGVLAKHMAESHRFDQPFSLLMLDVDHFKAYNDLFGHPAGDRLLAELAGLLRETAREVDYLVRYGGEEFAVLLPRVPKRRALVAAERHRRVVEERRFAHQAGLPGGNLTVSVGVASFPSDARSAEDLVHRADMALYAAKRGGRNRVASSGPERRRHPRVELQVPVDYRYTDEDRGAFLQGQTVDISLGGMRLATAWPVSPERPLEVVVQGGGAPPLAVTGAAVHVDHHPALPHPYSLGIRLAESAAPEPLARLVAERLQINV